MKKKVNKKAVSYWIVLICAIVSLICALVIGMIAIFDKGESGNKIWLLFLLALASGPIHLINLFVINKPNKGKEGDEANDGAEAEIRDGK